ELTYAFGGIADLELGRVRQVVSSHQLPARSERASWSVFAQNTWRATRRLSIDFGARYTIRPSPSSLTSTLPELVDYNSLPSAISRPARGRLWNTAWENLAPQVAVVYTLRAGSEWGTRLRSSWGISFDDLSAPGSIPFGRGEAYTSTRS